MSPEQQEFINTFKADEMPAQPTLPQEQKSEYEQAFADLTKAEKPALGSGMYGADSVHELSMGVGDASPTVLANTAEGTGSAMGTAEGEAVKPAGSKKPAMPAMGGSNMPQIRPDRSADEYINSFNSMARADAAEHAAAARAGAQEAMKLAGK